MTPLHIACDGGSLVTARALVAAGASVNALARVKALGASPVEIQTSPLACAACHGHAELVSFLLDSGADPNLGDDSVPVRPCSRVLAGCGAVSRGREPRARDGCAGAVAVARALPRRLSLTISYVPCLWPAHLQELRCTPLTAAIARGHEEVVRQLLLRRGGQAVPMDVEGCRRSGDSQWLSAPEQESTPEYDPATVSALKSRRAPSTGTGIPSSCLGPGFLRANQSITWAGAREAGITRGQGARCRALVQAALSYGVLATCGAALARWLGCHWTLALFLALVSVLLLLLAAARAWPRVPRSIPADGVPKLTSERRALHVVDAAVRRTGRVPLGSLLLCGPGASHTCRLCLARENGGGAGPGLGPLRVCPDSCLTIQQP